MTFGNDLRAFACFNLDNFREGEAPAEPHEQSRFPSFAARREPRLPEPYFNNAKALGMISG